MTYWSEPPEYLPPPPRLLIYVNGRVYDAVGDNVVHPKGDEYECAYEPDSSCVEHDESYST